MSLINNKYIEFLTTTICKELGLTIPFDIDDLIIKLNGKVSIESFDDEFDDKISGKIEKLPEDDTLAFLIKINEKKHKQQKRIRFTLAHELGHLFLHMGYLIDEKKWQETELYTDSAYHRFGYSEEEFEADAFATNLLMPKDDFINFVNSVQMNTIADYFQVSKSAVKTRAKRLGLLEW